MLGRVSHACAKLDFVRLIDHLQPWIAALEQARELASTDGQRLPYQGDRRKAQHVEDHQDGGSLARHRR
jgi:hypothetical protein